ncbi:MULTISPECIES: UDP-N-acetylmuramoyl-L-alanine--D-glutamate ligase [Ureibacillus]|jgi:UDP-N-acetylmuramoylalanine--D-glutamate ligase|uniref:UDP-N-acetylmuramoylalanine--D-glutamate ligase n=1 Tax=Ureibacillus thermosphaericus TaxID=51173 RepID=A0A840PR16_URETH|nr:UDP-N-acetylmuramoyl-L-alanine--D-glutamate ligase [Ureibacillus thermosphaericus]MBB5148939.1 UDP-N-acetylmuramoylalanine--D-glutamate ligase [Ureibacillus thermosphaericus]NKZ30885.1 UDP-N-acetylmuramoyl-L-alanine--D-glutamate ligase [Ureibacillus thermosphaericus]
MIHTTKFQHKKVLVLGLAKSGVAASMLLHKLGAFVTVNDAKPFEENPDAQNLLKMGITVICGRHPEDLLDEGFELVVKNPGIPYTNSIVKDALKKNIPVITEIELAYLVSEAPMIGITGTNGKTTTTTLIFEMLKAGNRKPKIAGNIGTVACGVAENASIDEVIVTELSSFQLMGIEQFKPKIAVLTNLYDAHLDYHGTFEEYAKAKFGITKNQTEEDYLIFNKDQDVVADWASKSNATKIPFSIKGRMKEGISADDSMIYWEGEPFIHRELIALPGKHNLQNILAAIAACNIYGCDKSAMEEVLKNFSGVRHRTQFVREWKGRKIYNDSKATNCLATKVALEAFHQPIVLIAGGLDRGHSFEELREAMKNVKAVVALGETKHRFIEFAKSCNVKKWDIATNIEEAVEKAAQLSENGDVILLSPACASWDQYKSFEVRGDLFIEAAMKLS